MSVPAAKDSAPTWVMIHRGTVWHYTLGKVLLGFVRATFGGWDGFICTGKKWPLAEKSLRVPYPQRIWEARKSVEWAVEDARVALGEDSK